MSDDPNKKTDVERGGDGQDIDALLGLVYDELRAIARRELRGERGSITFDPTDLVHEVYRKLANGQRARFKDQNHFKAVASRAIRNLLIDHARRRNSVKNGGGVSPLTFTDALSPAREGEGGKRVDLIDLERAMRELEKRDERQARLVELRFFGGMSNEDAAETLGIATRTATKDWKLAKSFLNMVIEGKGADIPSE